MKHSKLQQLASYLPYKLNCIVDGQHRAELNSVYSDGTCTFHDLVESAKGFKSIKPILKPLHSIDWHKCKEENPKNMTDNIDAFIDYFLSDPAKYESVIFASPYAIFQWCLANHYDVYNLLKTGEAVLDPDMPLDFWFLDENGIEVTVIGIINEWCIVEDSEHTEPYVLTLEYVKALYQESIDPLNSEE